MESFRKYLFGIVNRRYLARIFGWNKRIVVGLTLSFVAHNASAGLVGVKDIVVKNGIGYWMQVSEVVAQQTGTGNDLALASAGATAVGSSVWEPASNPGKAIDGIAPNAHADIFHSQTSSSSEFLKITLSQASELDSVTIFGRTDCCSHRDIFDLFLYDSQGVLLFEAFDLDARGSSHSATVSLPNTGTVPEPTTLAILGLGLAGIGFGRRKKA